MKEEKELELLIEIVRLLKKLTKQGNTIMTDLTALQQDITDLTAQVAAATTLDASVVTLIQGIQAQNTALAAQIADLTVGAVTQDQIDALAQQVLDQNTALTAGTTALQAAVTANTPAAP